jgi:hypothetical protein
VKCFEESNNTLKFATRAKKIKMEARVNETVDDKTLLRAYRLEIEQLKAKLAEVESVMQLKVSEQQTDVVDTEENQQLMLQMIDHMERLILKGEEKAKEEEVATRERRSSGEARKEMKTRKSEGAGAAGGMKAAMASANVNLPKRGSPSESVAVQNSPPVSARVAVTQESRASETKPSAQPRVTKESKIAQRKVGKKAPLRKAATLPVPISPAQIEETSEPATDSDQSRGGGVTGSRIEPLSLDSVDLTSSPSASARASASPLRRHNDLEEDNEDFFAGLSRGRESLLRASLDANDSPMTTMRNFLTKEKGEGGASGGNLLPSVIESILSGSRESLQPTVPADRDKVKDPVLHGVSQMLSILKQHVQKPKCVCPPLPPLPSPSLPLSLTLPPDNRSSLRRPHPLQRSTARSLNLASEGLRPICPSCQRRPTTPCPSWSISCAWSCTSKTPTTSSFRQSSRRATSS